MVRQARSEATRRRIIDSAVDLINGIGYHFESKEDLATAIIEEGATTVLDAFRGASRSTSPAMANIVYGRFTVTEVVTTDRIAQAGCRLLRTFGGFNPAAK